MRRFVRRQLFVRALATTIALVATAACHRSTPTLTADAIAPKADGSLTPDKRTRIPRDASRFDITSVTDSSVLFQAHEVDWLRAGMIAYVVDPLRRDALLAKVRVSEVHAAMVTGIITSQVTRVTTDHVLLLSAPPTAWWKSPQFWWGALVGGAVGGGIGASIKH